jgi:hypothetical protein
MQLYGYHGVRRHLSIQHQGGLMSSPAGSSGVTVSLFESVCYVFAIAGYGNSDTAKKVNVEYMKAGAEVAKKKYSSTNGSTVLDQRMADIVKTVRSNTGAANYLVNGKTVPIVIRGKFSNTNDPAPDHWWIEVRGSIVEKWAGKAVQWETATADSRIQPKGLAGESRPITYQVGYCNSSLTENQYELLPLGVRKGIDSAEEKSQ